MSFFLRRSSNIFLPSTFVGTDEEVKVELMYLLQGHKKSSTMYSPCLLKQHNQYLVLCVSVSTDLIDIQRHSSSLLASRPHKKDLHFSTTHHNNDFSINLDFSKLASAHPCSSVE